MAADEKTISRTDAVISSLRKLDDLRSDGIITDSEFRMLKSELIDQPGAVRKREDFGHTADDGNIRRYADTVFGSFVSELRTSDTGRINASPKGKYNFSPPRQTDARLSAQSLINDINNSLNVSADTRHAKAANVTQKNTVEDILADIDFSLGNAPHTEKSSDEDLTAGIDFSLDDTSPNNEDMTAGIDFSLDDNTSPNGEDMTAGIDFSLDDSDAADKYSELEKAVYYDKNEFQSRNYIARLIEKFSAKRMIYDKRNSALMNTERLEKLSIAPIFGVGAASALFFYFVLVTFAEMRSSLEYFLLLLCFWGGVAPACVIIPNSLKISRERKKAAEADAELREYYSSSEFTKIPYELTDPYILEYIEETAEGDSMNSIRRAAADLINSLNDDVLEKMRLQADTAENDDSASRAAAVYVLGKRMTSEKIS